MPRASFDALNRLCKWRAIFAGWQLGTRKKGDPECDAVRDHREVTIVMRAEITAVTQLLIAKGVFTLEEFDAQVITEAGYLERAYENIFPGVKATDAGLVLDPAKVAPWMKDFRP